MKTHRTTNHLAKGAAALLALLFGFGSMAATASAEEPAADDFTVCPVGLDCEPDDEPTPPGPWVPDPVFEACEIDPVTLTNPCDDAEESGSGGEVKPEVVDPIDTPVEATPTFTG